MNYPNKQIKLKNEYIDDLIISGSNLPFEVINYKKEFKKFNRAYESLVLEKELLNMSFDLQELIHYINSIEAKTNNMLKMAKTDEQKNEYKGMLSRIIFLKTKGIKYLKDYTIDHFKRDSYKCSDFCLDIEKNLYMRSLDNPFFRMNHYTGDIEYNVPAIKLASRIYNGNRDLKNTIEKIVRLINKEPKKKDSLMEELPKWASSLDVSELDTIVKIVPKTISECNLDALCSDVDFLDAFIDVENNIYIETHKKEIQKEIKNLIDRIIGGSVTESELTNLEVLSFFDSKTLPYKFREYLRKYDYDLDRIVDLIKKDELISSTYANQSGTLLFDHNGINYKNAYLLAEYVNGNTTVYRDLRTFYSNGDKRLLENIPEEVLGAEIAVVEKATVIQPFSRINREKYEKDRYDLRILQAIGLYKNSLK